MENLLEICEKLYIGNPPTVMADFIGKGNIWISNTYEDGVTDLAKIVLYKAIMETAPGQLSIIGYDSDLSGIFAPFFSLSSGGQKIMEFIQDEDELKERFFYLRQQIQSVQNAVQGRAESLTEFRRMANRPIEGYTLVVLAMDMGTIDSKILSSMATLMRSGPEWGCSFLIISTTYLCIQGADGKETEFHVESIAPNISILENNQERVRLLNTDQSAIPEVLKAETIIRDCDLFMDRVRNVALPTIKFEELHDFHSVWNKSSVDGLQFSIGKWGINDVHIIIGDEINQRHNAIITGAVGQGKSNLISVIIHSLCLQYSPRELRLYLLDFKEGVTFKSFSNIGKEEYLPHAEALGLESDVNFGLAVLHALYQEYQRRMKILKEKEYKSIRELRKKEPQTKMPRIVVIIDEFQMMFGDDIQTGEKIVEILEKSVRLFRAAGIHFILASQTLGGNLVLAQKRDAIFGQVPIRIALKNTLSESMQTLAVNNPAAAFLRPREAIVNLDYGEVSQNKKCVVAFADESVLTPLRYQWWEKAKGEYRAPYVFEGEKRIMISDSISNVIKKKCENSTPSAFFGERISIRGEAIGIPMLMEPGRNIAVIGAPDGECNQAVGMMESMAISLAVQHTKGDARFLFCNFTNTKIIFSKQYPHFSKLMEQCGYYLEDIPCRQFEETLRNLMEEKTENETVYMFGIGMDKWGYEPDPYGQGTVLKEFVEKGPSEGLHFFGWWVKASSYTAQVAGFGNSDAFNTKIFLRVDERAVQSLTSPFIRWKSQNNRGLLSDSVELEEELVFIPYAPVTSDDVLKIKAYLYEAN